MYVLCICFFFLKKILARYSKFTAQPCLESDSHEQQQNDNDDDDDDFLCVTSSKKDAVVLCESDAALDKLHEPAVVCSNIIGLCTTDLHIQVLALQQQTVTL